jgi:hypothetical protein
MDVAMHTLAGGRKRERERGGEVFPRTKFMQFPHALITRVISPSKCERVSYGGIN